METRSIRESIRQHNEQRELCEYQNKRVLTRPKTTVVSVVMFGFASLALLGIGVLCNIKISAPLALELPISIAFYLLITEVALRYLGIKIVECYQHYAKEITRRRCLCVPSCSEYAIACFKKYILIKALLKIKKRLTVTCKGPFYKIDLP